MKEYQGARIIGIDNGYGNIKTANCCFPAGLTAYDTEPVFKDELLVYGGRYYLIGTGHKEFTADKTGDDDYLYPYSGRHRAGAERLRPDHGHGAPRGGPAPDLGEPPAGGFQGIPHER